jgi:hypothetical protein
MGKVLAEESLSTRIVGGVIAVAAPNAFGAEPFHPALDTNAAITTAAGDGGSYNPESFRGYNR